MARASDGVTLRMILFMTHLPRVRPPALNDPDGIAEKPENLLTHGRREALDERLEVRQERIVRAFIQPASLGCELDLQAPAVFRVIDATDERLFLELIDHARHRAHPDVQVRGELAHGSGAPEVEDPEAVRLRHG